MKQLLLVIFCSSGIYMSTYGQSIEHALSFSFIDYGTTARSAGVAGAFSALGADMSSASTNPAGIAEFRKSEYVLSLGLPIVKSTGTLGGNVVSDDKIGPRLDNIGALFFYDPLSFDVKSFNLAIGANKIADFNRNFEYSGTTPGTRVERFLEQAIGLAPEELEDFEVG